ncbi:MAG: hypothetical protein F7C35_08195 [Desulfurococcales archaeon]|nr:hypothetical protein [Desulfurococcales archaeon]
MGRVVVIRGADLRVLSALADLLAECYGVRVELYKPRFSRRVDLRFEGERWKDAYNALAAFSSKVGWRLEP